MAYTQNELASRITEVLRLYPVQRGALFGSYARNEQTDASDIDLLLDLGTNKKHPHRDYIYDVIDTLESKLKRRVDCITVNGVATCPSALFRKKVEEESWWFYEA